MSLPVIDGVELGLKVSKKEFKAALPQLRTDLVAAQQELYNRKELPLILLIAGDDRISMTEFTQFLYKCMDPRFLSIAHIFKINPSDNDKRYPEQWRYWNRLPKNGDIGVYVGGWPMSALASHVSKNSNEEEFADDLAHMRQLEDSLTASGALVVKFWMHITKKELKQRLEAADSGDEDSWQIEETDRVMYKMYDKALPRIKTLLAATDTETCPWHLIDAGEDRLRDLTASRILLQRIKHRLSEDFQPPSTPMNSDTSADSIMVYPDAVASMDLTSKLTKEEYNESLKKYQRELASLSREARRMGIANIAMFEGVDAAGKGGAISRVAQAMSIRDYSITPIAAPTEEERMRHYLWRFWKNIPPRGSMKIFDRSWYGRVLVERVEGFCAEADWRRAYTEINDFEKQLVDDGIVLNKFWLQIDQEEQLRRFNEREITSYKKYKITADDYRNRNRWDDYAVAVNEMVARTSTTTAPWHLIPANDKKYARIQVLKTICSSLRRALK